MLSKQGLDDMGTIGRDLDKLGSGERGMPSHSDIQWLEKHQTLTGGSKLLNAAMMTQIQGDSHCIIVEMWLISSVSWRTS